MRLYLRAAVLAAALLPQGPHALNTTSAGGLAAEGAGSGIQGAPPLMRREAEAAGRPPGSGGAPPPPPRRTYFDFARHLGPDLAAVLAQEESWETQAFADAVYDSLAAHNITAGANGTHNITAGANGTPGEGIIHPYCNLPPIDADAKKNPWEDFPYADFGQGLCLVREPLREYYMGEGRFCKTRCMNNATCTGYSATVTDDCVIYTTVNLMPGGRDYHGAHCFIKTIDPNTGNLTVVNRGKGMCRIATKLPHMIACMVANTSDCVKHCNYGKKCVGYSLLTTYAALTTKFPCLLFLEPHLESSGNLINNTRCLVKNHKC